MLADARIAPDPLIQRLLTNTAASRQLQEALKVKSTFLDSFGAMVTF